jgi:hypothetical protein
MNNDVIDLLNRIKCCVDDDELRVGCGFIPHGSSRHWIFHGSYDVLENAADARIYEKVMNDRLNEAKALGLIINQTGKEKWLVSENWLLTEAGEAYLGQRTRGKIVEDEPKSNFGFE